MQKALTDTTQKLDKSMRETKLLQARVDDLTLEKVKLEQQVRHHQSKLDLVDKERGILANSLLEAQKRTQDQDKQSNSDLKAEISRLKEAAKLLSSRNSFFMQQVVFTHLVCRREKSSREKEF